MEAVVGVGSDAVEKVGFLAVNKLREGRLRSGVVIETDGFP